VTQIMTTKQPEQLSPAQRADGRRRYARFMLVNGFSVACLMNSVLILYGIKNGLSDSALAVLASFIHLAMPFMIFGKRMVASFGLARTWAYCWRLRYISVSLMLAAPWAASSGYAWAVTPIILAGAFGLFVFRSIGMIANVPLLGEITTPENQGQFISGNWLRLSSVSLLSTILLAVLLRYSDTLVTYQGIILFGAVVGLFASTLIAKVPESSAPQLAAKKPVKHSLSRLWRVHAYRRLMFAWAAALAGIMLINPFALMALKRGYLLADNQVLIFTLLGVTGGIVASLVCGLIADHTGPRPLLLIYAASLFAVALFWAFSPTVFPPIIVGVVFVYAGFCTVGIQVSIKHYFLASVDQEDRVGLGLFMMMATGAAAGLTICVFGGGILKLLTPFKGTGLALFQAYFLCVVILMIPLFWAISRLERLQEWRIRNVLGLFFSLRDVRALFALTRIRDAGPTADIKHVRKLALIGSNLSEDALLQYLDSGRLLIRVAALRGLRQLEFGARTEEALLNELRNGEYTTAWYAADILGEHRIEQAVPLLRDALDSSDVFLQSKAMVALARLHDEESYVRIMKMFRDSQNPRVLIHGADAIAMSAGVNALPDILAKSQLLGLPDPVVESLLITAADMCGYGNEVYAILREHNHSNADGVSSLSGALRALPEVHQAQADAILNEIGCSATPAVAALLALVSEAEFIGKEQLTAFLQQSDPPPGRRLTLAFSYLAALSLAGR